MQTCTRVHGLLPQIITLFKNTQVTLTNVENSATMKTGNTATLKNIKAENAMGDIQYVGKINREIFKVISDDIQTDEVIITDVQIQHINERHPGDFKEIRPFLKEALSAPDYILQDGNNGNTGLILKKINTERINFQIVLRLHTSSDPEDYMNSIISTWKISDSRWKNYIKNKIVLYKRE